MKLVKTKTIPFSWANVADKPSLQQGEICVIRLFNGMPEMLRITNPLDYKEYSGCFSYIGACHA